MSVALPLLAVLFAASALPWLLLLRARFGHRLAIPMTAGGALLLLFVVLLASRLLGVDGVAALAVGSVIAGVVGGILVARAPHALRRPARLSVALWRPALLGALVWVLTAVLAQVIPGASRLGWVMNGDALNNIWYASVIQHSDGLALGAAENPVPLPAALISVALGTGPAATASSAAALSHELTAFTVTWVTLLAVTCVAMGVVVASAIDVRNPRAVAVASGLGSLLPLTWFVSGLTVQWGYFNLDVLLPILLASWLVFLASTPHPVAAFTTLTVLATLALATWTPAALLPVALGLVILIRDRAAFRRPTRLTRAATALGIAQFVVWIGVVTIPTFLSEGSVLEIPGVGFPALWWGLLAVTAVLLVALVVVRHRFALPLTAGTVALVAAGVVASGVLLFFASDQPDVFGAYYPKKFAWILVVVFGAIALSFVVSGVAGRAGLGGWPVAAAVICLVLLCAAALPVGGWPETVERQPVARILGDHVRHGGEQTVADILRLTAAGHPTILWQSGNPDEPIINEYLLVANGGFVHGDTALRTLVSSPYFTYRATGRYDDSDVGSLCSMIRAVPARPVIRTASRTLAARLRAACPAADATVLIDTSLRGPRPTTTGATWQEDGIE
jgi:hypothetical protein